MQPRSKRRVHGAEFKAQVLAECQQLGASMAAIALAHGLNVHLLRKWLVGHGIKRAGLAAPVEAPALSTPDIHIELNRGATRLSMCWPSTQAAACTAWLRELAAVALKD